MGLYNDVTSAEPCPRCHAPVAWQSKRLTYAGLLLANAMQVIDLKRGIDGEMHAYCGACGARTDAVIRNGVVAERQVIGPQEPGPGQGKPDEGRTYSPTQIADFLQGDRLDAEDRRVVRGFRRASKAPHPPCALSRPSPGPQSDGLIFDALV